MIQTSGVSRLMAMVTKIIDEMARSVSGVISPRHFLAMISNFRF
jgi:hypothetical protein